jgi:hypothetical protein
MQNMSSVDPAKPSRTIPTLFGEQQHCVLGNVGGIPPERYSWVPYPFSRSWGVPPTIAVCRSPPNIHFLVPLFFFVQLFVALIINILNLLASSLHHKPAFTLFSCPTLVVQFQLYYSLVFRSFWLPYGGRLDE